MSNILASTKDLPSDRYGYSFSHESAVEIIQERIDEIKKQWQGSTYSGKKQINFELSDQAIDRFIANAPAARPIKKPSFTIVNGPSSSGAGTFVKALFKSKIISKDSTWRSDSECAVLGDIDSDGALHNALIEIKKTRRHSYAVSPIRAPQIPTPEYTMPPLSLTPSTELPGSESDNSVESSLNNCSPESLDSTPPTSARRQSIATEILRYGVTPFMTACFYHYNKRMEQNSNPETSTKFPWLFYKHPEKHQLDNKTHPFKDAFYAFNEYVLLNLALKSFKHKKHVNFILDDHLDQCVLDWIEIVKQIGWEVNYVGVYVSQKNIPDRAVIRQDTQGIKTEQAILDATWRQYALNSPIRNAANNTVLMNNNGDKSEQKPFYLRVGKNIYILNKNMHEAYLKEIKAVKENVKSTLSDQEKSDWSKVPEMFPDKWGQTTRTNIDKDTTIENLFTGIGSLANRTNRYINRVTKQRNSTQECVVL